MRICNVSYGTGAICVAFRCHFFKPNAANMPTVADVLRDPAAGRERRSAAGKRPTHDAGRKRGGVFSSRAVILRRVHLLSATRCHLHRQIINAGTGSPRNFHLKNRSHRRRQHLPNGGHDSGGTAFLKLTLVHA